MAEYLQAPPRRKALGLLADALTSGQEALNTVNLPYVGGLGGLLLGQAPEYLQDVSYGMPAFRGGNVATGGLGTLTPDTRMLDVATLPFVGAGAAKAGQVGAKTLGKEIARQVETGTGLIGSNVLDPRQYMFIGEKSKAWDTTSNKVAKALEKEGLAPETIWSQTGNVKAPDGKWRQEISDVGAKFETPDTIKNKISLLTEQTQQSKDLLKRVNTESRINPDLFPKQLSAAKKEIRDSIKVNERNLGNNKVILDKLEYNSPFMTKAENYYSNPQLYEAYPELGKYPLSSNYPGNGYYGSFNDNFNVNVYKQAFEEGKAPSTAAHEFQHAIQDIEGFNRGGSLSNINTILQQTKPDIYMQLANEKKLLDPMTQSNMYKNLAGEAEARLTQSRLNLTPEQRLQYFPFKFAPNEYGLDRPLEDLIVHGLLK